MRLGDVATYVNGYAFKPSDWSDTGVPIIRIQDLTGNAYQANRYNGEYSSKYEVNSGDVLISWSASLGVYVWTGETAVLNQHIFKVIFDKATVNKSFFVHQVQRILDEAASEAHGATMKHLTKPVFDALPFYLPSINRQDEIAAVLDKISNLIDLHKQQLEKLDELVKSRFIELFGNTETNPRGLPVVPWQEVFLTTTGKLDSNAMVEGGKYPFFTCAKEIFRIDTYAFDCEALLLAGNNAAGVYDVKHYKGKFNAYQRTYVLRLINEQWSYKLFKRQLEDKLSYLQSQSKGTNTRYLTLGILNELQFLVPPLEEQKAFTFFVEQVDKSKLAVQKGLEELEILKKSLMQQYFG
jgi:type I restriction enzyme S subunit